MIIKRTKQFLRIDEAFFSFGTGKGLQLESSMLKKYDDSISFQSGIEMERLSFLEEVF